MNAELRDSLEPLFPDSVIHRRPCTAMELDVARGGTAAVHVLVSGAAEGEPLRATVRDARGPVRGAKWFRLLDVPVEVNTGLELFTEPDDPDGQVNPYVIRRAPFRVYDAMSPIEETVPVAATPLALRLHVPVPDRAAGATGSRCGRGGRARR